MNAAGDRTIDLNADLGEGFGAWSMGDDDALLDVVTSANIACGFHAGDPRIMRRTCEAAAARGVAIGAHVSYRDLEGFGRRDLDVAADRLTDELLYQIGALDAIARATGSRVRYVKAHGALYNRCAHDTVHAAALVHAVRAYDRGLVLLAAPGSVAAALAIADGLPLATEAFVDRAYRPDGRLVPRGEPGAVLTDATAGVEQARRLAVAGEVVAVDGTVLALGAQSLCVHGDTPHAVTTAWLVRDALREAGVALRPFT